MNIKHTIYTNNHDYSDDYMNEIRESISENRDIPVEEVTDGQVYEEIGNLDTIYFEDEERNLDQETDGRILIVASLGLWNGRRQAYKLCDRRNLNEVLMHFCGDYVTVGTDGRDVVASDTHHDGTNYYTFREVREDRNIDVLTDKLYYGTATRKDITRYTRTLVHRVNAIYGWGKRRDNAKSEIAPLTQAA